MIHAHAVHRDIAIAALEIYYRNVLRQQPGYLVTSGHADAVDDKIAVCFNYYLPPFGLSFTNYFTQQIA